MAVGGAGGRHRYPGPLYVVAGALVAALVLASVLLSLPGSPPGSWTERTVTLVPNAGSYACYFVYSTAHSNRYCLALWYFPAAETLNGTFDHGPGTPTVPIALCIGFCGEVGASNETNATWTSPDGTGLVYWTFGVNVTLGAQN